MAEHHFLIVQICDVELGGAIAVRRRSMMGAAIHDRAAWVTEAGKLAGEAWDDVRATEGRESNVRCAE